MVVLLEMVSVASNHRSCFVLHRILEAGAGKAGDGSLCVMYALDDAGIP